MTTLEILQYLVTSTLACLQIGPLSWLKWNLETLVFAERKIRKLRGNTSEKGKNQKQTQPTHGTGPELNVRHNGGRKDLSPLTRSCITKTY